MTTRPSSHVACTAAAYHANGTIRPAHDAFEGTIDGGWEVIATHPGGPW